MKTGTPQSLGQALENAVEEYHSQMGKRVIPEVCLLGASWHVRDFLAQKFTVAFTLAASPEERKRLEILFEKLTRE